MIIRAEQSNGCVVVNANTWTQISLSICPVPKLIPGHTIAVSFKNLSPWMDRYLPPPLPLLSPNHIHSFTQHGQLVVTTVDEGAYNSPVKVLALFVLVTRDVTIIGRSQVEVSPVNPLSCVHCIRKQKEHHHQILNTQIRNRTNHFSTNHHNFFAAKIRIWTTLSRWGWGWGEGVRLLTLTDLFKTLLIEV